VSGPFWVVAGAIFLSGFFALVSYSLRAYRRAQLEESFNGSSGKHRLEALERHLTALRLTASLCRAAANLTVLLGMLYLLDVPSGRLGAAAVAAAISAGLIAIFGVAVPHAWASCAGDRILAATLGVMMFFRYALYPVTAVMQAFDLPIRRLSGARPEEDDNGEALKHEILQAATEGRAEGAVEPEELEMIASVMQFGRTDVAKTMTPRTDIFALPLHMPFGEACKRLVQAGHTRVPIYEGDIDNIIGVLYAKDLLGCAAGAEPPPLRSIMRKPFFVPETKPVDDLLREFKARKVHMAIVLDEYGGTAGLVTIEDLVEEIVGEISDEYDRATPALMSRIDKKTAEVDGRMCIDDLNDAMGLNVPEDGDYDTVAGFVFSQLGYIPAVGETVESHGARLTVLGADERRIMRLRVELLTDKRRQKEHP